MVASWHTPAIRRWKMLRLAQTAALVCCDREMSGMTERPVWAARDGEAPLNSDPMLQSSE